MKKKFAPTANMVAVAEAVFKAMAYVDTIRPIVMKYQTEILQQGQWHICPKFGDRFGDKVILEPKYSYLMSKEDLAVFIDRCKVARNQAGLHVEHDDQCPLLVAEHLLIRAKRALLDVMEPVTRLQADRLLNAGLDKFESCVEMSLQLLAPFVNSKLEKPSAPSAAGFDALFAEVVEEFFESHPDLKDGETVAAIKETIRDDFQTTRDELQDRLQLQIAIEKKIERVESTDKLRM